MEPLPDSATVPAASPAPSRSRAAVQILVVLLVLGAWMTLLKVLGLQEYLRARLPRSWVYLDILGTGAFGLVTLAVVLRGSREDWRSVGLRPTPAAPALAWGVVASIACYAGGGIAQLVALALLRTNATEMATQKLKNLDVLSDVPFALMLPLALFAGVYEEILFRGFLLSRLRTALEGRALGRNGAVVLAVVLSSLLFGLGHAYQGVPGVMQTFAVGAVLCAFAVWRGNIWSCIAAHALVDAFGLFALKVLRPMAQQVLEAAKHAAAQGADAGTK